MKADYCCDKYTTSVLSIYYLKLIIYVYFVRVGKDCLYPTTNQFLEVGRVILQHK